MGDASDIRLAQLALSLRAADAADVARALEEARRRREAGGVGVSIAVVLVERGALAKETADRLHRLLQDGILACVDAADGARRWKGGRYGHGQLLLVEDLLLVMAEGGEIVLVEATPAEHRELARFAVLDDKTWNPPALAAPYLLVRNDLEAVCLELPLAAPIASMER